MKYTEQFPTWYKPNQNANLSNLSQHKSDHLDYGNQASGKWGINEGTGR